MNDRSLRAWERPVLQSVVPIIDGTRHVTTSHEAVERVADWMAYEELGVPAGGPAGPSLDWAGGPDQVIDAIMVKATIDFAFSDFETGERFEVDYGGMRRSDSDAMFACLHQAHVQGVPVLDGAFLAGVGRDDLEDIFQGSIEMPMLDERAAILNDVGATLVDGHSGRFSAFVRSCDPAAYSDGSGLLERLVTEFPRFSDTSDYHGSTVVFHKLAQLAVWSLHTAVGPGGGVVVDDLDALSAFADYVVPVGLRLMGIIEYDDDLEARVEGGVIIERDSDEEVEIRAHSVYATAVLTEAINRRRPEDRRIVIPQVDYRLWSTYHATWRPNHLTRTVMY
jgi:hypothetical protein